MANPSVQGNCYAPARIDGTDPTCGSVRYEVGEEAIASSDALLPAATHEGEAWPGFWPCRLFKVKTSGPAKIGFRDLDPHYGLFSRFHVVDELPSARIFGPQGAAVERMLARLVDLDLFDLEKLRAYHPRCGGIQNYSRTLSYARRAALFTEPRATYRYRGAHGAYELGYRAIMREAQDHQEGRGDLDAVQLFAIAPPAVIVCDTLRADYYDLLVQPWRDVFGREVLE